MEKRKNIFIDIHSFMVVWYCHWYTLWLCLCNQFGPKNNKSVESALEKAKKSTVPWVNLIVQRGIRALKCPKHLFYFVSFYVFFIHFFFSKKLASLGLDEVLGTFQMDAVGADGVQALGVCRETSKSNF